MITDRDHLDHFRCIQISNLNNNVHIFRYGLIQLGGMSSKKAKSATVLIHSAAGGVGLFACDIVKGLGGAVIATIGSEGKVDFLMKRTGLKREQIIVRRGGGNTFGKQGRNSIHSKT